MIKTLKAKCLLILMTVGCAAVWEPTACRGQNQDLRKYEQGPLKGDEFTGQAPAPLPKVQGLNILASTYCEIRYTYRFRTQSMQGRYVSQAENVEYFSVFVPEKSWNKAVENAQLLDHEQGHFDLTELHARRAQERLSALHKAGKMRSTGATEKQVVDDLVKMIEVELKKANEELLESHQRYDRETLHGSDETKQKEWRAKMNADLRKTVGFTKKKL